MSEKAIYYLSAPRYILAEMANHSSWLTSATFIVRIDRENYSCAGPHLPGFPLPFRSMNMSDDFTPKAIVIGSGPA
nr:hypothetical protein [Candidatus Krumholzibacteria bacterium]